LPRIRSSTGDMDSDDSEYRYRDSNPGFRRERAAS
jgi:hypothetical protein